MGLQGSYPAPRTGIAVAVGARVAQQGGLQGDEPAPAAGSAVGLVGSTRSVQPVGLQGSYPAPRAGIAVAIGARVAQQGGLQGRVAQRCGKRV